MSNPRVTSKGLNLKRLQLCPGAKTNMANVMLLLLLSLGIYISQVPVNKHSWCFVQRQQILGTAKGTMSDVTDAQRLLFKSWQNAIALQKEICGKCCPIDIKPLGIG